MSQEPDYTHLLQNTTDNIEKKMGISPNAAKWVIQIIGAIESICYLQRIKPVPVSGADIISPDSIEETGAMVVASYLDALHMAMQNSGCLSPQQTEFIRTIKRDAWRLEPPAFPTTTLAQTLGNDDAPYTTAVYADSFFLHW